MNNIRRYSLLGIFASLVFISSSVLACGPGANKTHMGQLLNVDKTAQTFTIRDAETSKPVTFAANSDILGSLSGVNGNLMVNYEQTDQGLKAVGVTF